MIKFMYEKDKSILNESKKLIEDYKNEMGVHQLKYLDLKRHFDNAGNKEIEQSALVAKLERELKLNDQRLGTRNDQIMLLKDKCATLDEDNEIIRIKKLDLELVVDNLVEEINQLKLDDEACRKILDRRNQLEKIRGSGDSNRDSVNISVNKSLYTKTNQSRFA